MYKILNLDGAEEYGFGDRRVRSIIGKPEDSPIGVAYIIISIQVGTHYHPNTDEYYLVLEGRGNLKIGEETRTIGKNDFVYVPRGTHHSIETLDEIDLIMLVITYPPWVPEEEIEIEE